MAKEISEELKQKASEHLDHLIDLMKSIQLNKITILTGGNGKGKSLIRKLIHFYIENKLGIKDQKKRCVVQVSMQLRTESRPEWGALSSMAHDWPTTPTSLSTISLIKGMFSQSAGKYIVIDEPEIGMSAEMQLALCKKINETLPTLEDIKGVLIITHSQFIIKNLKHDEFVNIEGMTEDEWLNREIVPADIDELDNFSTALFREVESRQKKED